MGWRAAIDLVRDVLFKNANKLYHLEIEFEEIEEEAGGVVERSYQSDAELLRAFLKNQPAPDFVRICWNDYTATQRMRMVPFRKFTSLLNEGKSTDISIPAIVFALIQNDHLLPSVPPVGEYRLHPDFSSLRKGPIEGHISMNGEFRESSGARVPLCPRTVLHQAVEYGAQNNLSFLVGFEVEFLLVERVERQPGDTSDTNRYSTLTTDGHAWSVSRYFANPKIAALLRDMVAALEDAGIFIEQLHAESAAGQFEFILPPYPPVEAADTLLHTRDVMSALATAAGFRLTLHPKPFPDACGTGSHMHLSLASPGGDSPATYRPFYAGVLKHLRAVCAFTYTSPASYERCLPGGAWAGGRWVAWGTQNREAALRKVEGSHWEVKIVDGLANPYLVVAAVLFAGIKGVVDREVLTWGDCEIDPAKMTENDRKELGVEEMLPGSVAEGLEALRADVELAVLMGRELVERFVAVKEFEMETFGDMGDEERRQWLMERY
jgi:glutamine synthetase